MKISGWLLALVWALGAVGVAQAQVTPGLPPLTIAPPVSSNTQGLLINQTTPSTGTPTGPILLNTITLLDQGQSVTTSGLDSFGQQNSATAAFRVSDRVSGGGGTHDGISVAVNITGSHGGAVGIQSGVYSNVNATGTIWSVLGYSNIGASGVQATMVGLESEVLIATGGSATNRIGVNINSQGPVAASSIDTAIAVELLNNTLGAWAGPAAPFGSFVTFSNTLYGASAQPIATTGSIFNSDAMTITNFANMANVTVSGSILKFPNVVVSGAGLATFGSSTLSTQGGVLTTCASCGAANIFGQTNSTTGADALTLNDSSGNDNMSIGLGEASNTTTRFGQTLGNFGLVSTFGSTNVGLLIGTVTSQPLILGTNNAARLTISGAGAINANGNQLNNVIIGTSTPLAGSFTTVQTVAVAVGSLPTCNAGAKGTRSFVTDNNTALAFAAVLTTGGTIQTPVYCDGTTWRQG